MNISSRAGRIAIGAAQFGLPYGVANRVGKVADQEVQRILASAMAHSVSVLDTAIAYGDSERVLGSIGVAGWKIITKLPEIPYEGSEILTWMNAQVQGSLTRLRTDNLEALLLHRPAQLYSTQGPLIYDALCGLRERGLVRKIGLSIYAPEELDNLPKSMHFDIIQAPFNVLDRRIIDSGWAWQLNSVGTELHVRSVFLQGLLVMPPDLRPAYFRRWSSLLGQWDDWLATEGIDAVEACLSFALAFNEIGKVVVGLDSMEQWGQIANAVQHVTTMPPECLSSTDLDLIVPSRWSI